MKNETPIINVDGIGKKYQLGFIRKNNTVRDSIAHNIKKYLNRNQQEKKITKEIEKEFWALRNISFNVCQGDVLGIIGRNGAGKSTLLKVLSRITHPSEGEITIKGRVSSLLEVGTGFHPELSGRENIYMNGSILGMSRSEIISKFDEIVDFAEIERFVDTPVKRYSSGMYVRLAFAVAAHLEPEVLIVDEVLAVGDVEFQNKCLGKMKDVSSSGRTVLFVSHNMGAVRNLVKRCMLIEKGGISYIGNTEECIDRYLNLYSDGDNKPSINLPEKVVSTDNPIYIKTISLFAPEKGETNVFFLGDPWAIDIQIESVNEGIKFQIDIEILNKDGIKMNHLVMSDSGINEIRSRKGQMGIRVSIEQLKLYPGTYYVSVFAGSAGNRARQNFDYLQSVIAFTVSHETSKAVGSFTKGNNVVIHDLSKSKATFFEIGKWEII
jgi:lipopolysaccharide transport system ATP-binding protein